MQEKLLPNYSKKIAFPIGILCIIGLFFIRIWPDSLLIDEHVTDWIFKDLLLVSLVVMILSREKEESPAIHETRYRELLNALTFGVIIVIYDSVANFFYSNGFEEMRSGYELLLMMLIYYLFSFFIRTKIKDPSRT